MRKLILLFAAFGCVTAQAQTQEIDAVSATQGTTTGWFRLAGDKVNVTSTDGNLVFTNKTYDIVNGEITGQVEDMKLTQRTK